MNYILMQPQGIDRYALMQWYCAQTPIVKRARRVVAINDVDVRSKDFLKTTAWRRLRMEVLIERGAQCECCGARPPAVVINVDHIKPRLKYPELALDKANLQVLCELCNHGKGNLYETDWRRDRPTITDAPALQTTIYEATREQETVTALRNGDSEIQQTRMGPRLVRKQR